jgi:hypothetical protein
MYWWFSKCREGTSGGAALRRIAGQYFWEKATELVKGNESNGAPNTWVDFLDCVGFTSATKSRKQSGELGVSWADIMAAAAACHVDPSSFIPGTSYAMMKFMPALLGRDDESIQATFFYLNELIKKNGRHQTENGKWAHGHLWAFERDDSILDRMGAWSPLGGLDALWQRINRVLAEIEMKVGESTAAQPESES